jgi:hypothetical protein
VLCTSDEIIRGKESDVASYMIHANISCQRLSRCYITRGIAIFQPLTPDAMAVRSNDGQYVGLVESWVGYVLSHLIG